MESKLILQLFLVLICTIVALAGKLEVEDCPSGTKGAPSENSINVTHFSIIGCNAHPCKFVKTTIVKGKVKAVFDFTSSSKNKLQYTAIAVTKIGPIELLTGEMCEYLQPGVCDKLERGTVIETKFSQRIEEIFPIFDGDVRVVIKKDSKPIFCGQIPVIIEEKPLW